VSTRGHQLNRVALSLPKRAKPTLDRSITRCHLCDGIAHYIVGRKGFCAQHKSDAYRAASRSKEV
jgi:hypothetical protein